MMDFKGALWFDIGRVFLISWKTVGLLGLYVVTRQRRSLSLFPFSFTTRSSWGVWASAFSIPILITFSGYFLLSRMYLRGILGDSEAKLEINF